MARSVAGSRVLVRSSQSSVNHKPLTLNICHLYPDLMDTYGDKGNILTLKYRCEKRGIKFNLITSTINDKPSTINENIDFFFFGGGQDQAQSIVSKDLRKKATKLKNAVEEGVVMLSICGGYQLLQKYFKTDQGTIIEGIGIFNAYTEASETRMMQNLQVKINPRYFDEIKAIYPTTMNTLIGFENHSGKTYLEEGTAPLGMVLSGSGNNGQDKLEGAVYKNAFGCYLHGSLLPKNPHFADSLITKALERRYGKVNLQPLDDWLEWQAHEQATKRVK